MNIVWSPIATLTLTAGKHQLEHALFLRPYQEICFPTQLIRIGSGYAQAFTAGLQAPHMALPQAGPAIDHRYCFEQPITILQAAIES